MRRGGARRSPTGWGASEAGRPPRRPAAARGGRGLRVHLLLTILPLDDGPAPAVPRGPPEPLRVLLDPLAARRREHVVGDGLHRGRRFGVEGPPRSPSVDGPGGG